MIKFFRRIRQKLLSENRFSKYLLYAIGEILLVVIGILIALGINNWNGERSRKVLEKEVIEQLFFDFSTNQKAIEYFQNQYQDNLKVINVTLRNTGPNATVPKAEVFDSITKISTPKVQLLYASKSNDSGVNIELLENRELKQKISVYQFLFNRYSSAEENLMDLTLRQRRIHQRYMSLIADEEVFSSQQFENDTLGFLRDKQFQNITVDKKWNTNDAIFFLKNVENQNDSIILLLKREQHNFQK